MAIVTATGTSVKTRSSNMAAKIEAAMVKAVVSALEMGITDPVVIKQMKEAARVAVKASATPDEAC
jgi:hypothetical protein